MAPRRSKSVAAAAQTPASQPTEAEDARPRRPSDERLHAFLLKGDPLFSKHSGVQKLNEFVDFKDFMEPRLEAMMADFPEDYVPLAVDSRATTNRRAKENYKQTYITDENQIKRFLLGSGVKPQVCWDGVDRSALKRKLEENKEEEVVAKRVSPRKKEVPAPSPTAMSSTSGSGLNGFRIPKRSKH
ncbi:hypothetical protein CAEBREN_09902 [Caenorhabditis brenneri]|uniref:Uncharacterized protein n=1 Tax=Caenorhabditis brenneri TaxID=135651 RepID=G0PF08_CAEBE|nr:hypothetical protein CAEBREN_09902 [Caenorhabditis brenneri]